MNRLVSMACRLRAAGHKRYGIAALFEVLRYQESLTTTGSEFKLCNNHRALYARKIMAEVDGLEGFFTTRKRPSVDDPE